MGVVPEKPYDYVKSIIKRNHPKLEMTKMYSKFMVNRWLSLHRNTIGIVDYLNTTKIKLTDQEHYDILYAYCKKVEYIPFCKYVKEVKYEPELFKIAKLSLTDLKRILEV